MSGGRAGAKATGDDADDHDKIYSHVDGRVAEHRDHEVWEPGHVVRDGAHVVAPVRVFGRRGGTDGRNADQVHRHCIGK